MSLASAPLGKGNIPIASTLSTFQIPLCLWKPTPSVHNGLYFSKDKLVSNNCRLVNAMCRDYLCIPSHVFTIITSVSTFFLGEEIKYKLENVVQVTHLIGDRARV